MKEKLWIVDVRHRESKRKGQVLAAGLNCSEALDNCKKAYPDWYAVQIIDLKTRCALMVGDHSTELT